MAEGMQYCCHWSLQNVLKKLKPGLSLSEYSNFSDSIHHTYFIFMVFLGTCLVSQDSAIWLYIGAIFVLYKVHTFGYMILYYDICLLYHFVK